MLHLRVAVAVFAVAIAGSAGCAGNHGTHASGGGGAGATRDGGTASTGAADGGGADATSGQSRKGSAGDAGPTLGDGGDSGSALHADGGRVGDAGRADAGTNRGAITVSGWDALPGYGQFALDDTGKLYAWSTSGGGEFAVISANGATLQPAPTIASSQTVMLTSDGLGNIYTTTAVPVTGGTKWELRRLAPGARAWQPTKYTADVTASVGLRRDRLGSIYLLDLSSAQLSASKPGGDAFQMLPGYPGGASGERVTSVSSSADGTLYIAVNGNLAMQALSLAPGASKWSELPAGGTVNTTPITVEADTSGNVYEVGSLKMSGGYTCKLPVGASSWVLLTGGPTHATAWTETPMVGPVYTPDSLVAPLPTDVFPRLAVDAQNRLVVSLWNDKIYRSRS